MAIKKSVVCLTFFLFLRLMCPVIASVNTDGQNGVERTISAKPFGTATLNFGLTVDYAQSMDYVKGPTVPGYSIFSVVDESNTLSNVLQDPAKMVSSNFFMALGLADFCDFSLALPFYYDWAGFKDVSDGGLGDLEITTKLLFPPIALNKLFYQSLVLSMTVPTGMRGSGLFPRQTHFITSDSVWNPAVNFYSTDYITVKPMLAFTVDLASLAPSIPLQIHINVGGVFTEAHKQNTMIGAMAVEYKPADFLTLFADFSGESRWQNLSAGYNLRKDPLWATPGLRITNPSGVYLSIAGDFSMSSTSDQDRLNWDKKGYRYSTGVMPFYGVRLSCGWNGLLISPDKMTAGPGTHLERCLNQSQLSNGLVDLDGCPDFDNAADSPKNVVAPSPDSAATAENSTVPDYETARNRAVDSSGVYFDESQDDADPDSVVASPKKVPEFPQQQIVQGLEFKNGKTELLFSSFSSLDKLIKPLKDCPDVQIEVRAYTDALGKANANMQLTQMRAEAIRQYLINQGIDPQRISAKGCGSGNPIGDNRTAAGRTLNRRIEIVRTK